MLKSLLIQGRFPALAVLMAGILGCAYLWANMAPLLAEWSGWPFLYYAPHLDIEWDRQAVGYNLLLFPVLLVVIVLAGAPLMRSSFLRKTPKACQAPTAFPLRWCADLLTTRQYGVLSLVVAAIAGSAYVHANMLTWGAYVFEFGWPTTYYQWYHSSPLEPRRSSDLLMAVNIVLFPVFLLLTNEGVQRTLDRLFPNDAAAAKRPEHPVPRGLKRVVAEALSWGVAGMVVAMPLWVWGVAFDDQLMWVQAHLEFGFGLGLGLIGYGWWCICRCLSSKRFSRAEAAVGGAAIAATLFIGWRMATEWAIVSDIVSVGEFLWRIPRLWDRIIGQVAFVAMLAAGGGVIVERLVGRFRKRRRAEGVEAG